MSEEAVERANETANDLAEAIKKFEERATRLYLVFDACGDWCADLVAENYPFERSFDELAYEITGWSGEARAQLAGISVEELSARGDGVFPGFPEGTEAELKTAIDAFAQAAYGLSDAWQSAISAHDDAGTGDVAALAESSYPFGSDFHEIVFEISNWSQSVHANLNSETAPTPGG